MDGKARSFLLFCFFQGLVMFFQNSYQSKRLYVRRALGKASQIDVDASETLIEKPTDLKILIPLLFLLYVFQLYLGVDFAYFVICDFSHHQSHAHSTAQLFFSSCLFVVLSIGNVIATVQVVMQKTTSEIFKEH